MIQPHVGKLLPYDAGFSDKAVFVPWLATNPDLLLLEEQKDEMGEELVPAMSGDSRSTGDFSAKEIFDVIHMVAEMV